MQIFAFYRSTQAFVEGWLIPEACKQSPILLRKARVLVFLHLFLFLISLWFHLSNTFFYPSAGNPALVPAMMIVVGLSILFKWKGNFALSGNLLALFLTLVLMSAVPTSGGLYSDNLLWMMASPLLALLFANVTSGLLWLVFLLGYTGYLYHLELSAAISYREQTLELDAMYYLITYCGLFIIVVGVVLIFAEGQNIIIKALNNKQAELEQQKEEISRQARHLREAQAKLKLSNKELEQFAYAASHDLKEPLRMINNYVQLIERRMAQQLDDSTRQYMHFVTDGVKRMDKLLSDLLDYSKVGRQDALVKDTNLNDILFVVVNNLMTAMKDSEAQISSNTLPVIKAPSMLMVQLLQNLLSNAIKFRQKDVPPVIDILYEFHNGEHHFIIRDNGIGIPESQKERVFNIFERLHGRDEYEGTGIGLATCKKIIKNMGGDIWVKPEDRQGSTFVFCVPSFN